MYIIKNLKLLKLVGIKKYYYKTSIIINLCQYRNNTTITATANNNKRYLFPNLATIKLSPSKSLAPSKILNNIVNYNDITLKQILKTLDYTFNNLKINPDYISYSELIYTKPNSDQIKIIIKLVEIILERNLYCKSLSQEELNFIIGKLAELKVEGLSEKLFDCVIRGRTGYSAGLNESILNNLIILITLDNNLEKLDKLMKILQINNYTLYRESYYQIFNNLANYSKVEFIHLFYNFTKLTQEELLDINYYSKLIESYSICNRLDLAELVIKELKVNGLKIPAELENLFEFQFNEINRTLNYYHSSFDLLLTGRNKFNDIAKKTSEQELSIDQCQKKINELDDQRIKPNIEDFNNLIQSNLNLGYLREAKWICKNLEGRKIAPNANTFELFLNYYCVNKNLPRATSTFEEMLNFELLPNLEAWNILILLNCKLGNLTEMYNLLEKLKSSNIRLNCTVFYSIVKLLVKEGNSADAIQVYNKMIQWGVPIAPGFKFRCLIQLFKLKEAKLAKNLYLLITPKELLNCPNLNKTVFFGHCLFSELQDILAYLGNWENNYDNKINSSILNKCIELIILRGEVDWIRKVLYQVLNINNGDGSLITSNTLSMILQTCVDKKDYSLFNWLLNIIKRYKLDSKLEFKHYKLIIIIYNERREYYNINNVIEEMIEYGIKLNSFLLNVYMTSLQKTKKFEEFQIDMGSAMKSLPNEITKDVLVLNNYLIKLIQFNGFEDCYKLIEEEFIPNNIKVTSSVKSNLFNSLRKLGNNEELINRFNILLKN